MRPEKPNKAERRIGSSGAKMYRWSKLQFWGSSQGDLTEKMALCKDLKKPCGYLGKVDFG